MVNTITIKIDEEDLILLMNDGKKLYLEAHPEMEGVYITQRKMFREVIKYYLES